MESRPAYLVEVLGGTNNTEGAVVAEVLGRAAHRLAGEGVDLELLGVTSIPEDDALLCRWRSGSEQAVRSAHALARIGVARLTAVVDVSA